MLNRFKYFFKIRAQSKDFYVGIVLFCLSLGLLIYLIPSHVNDRVAQGQLVKPSTFPYLISYIILLFSIILIWNSHKTELSTIQSEDKQISRPMIGLIALLFVFYFSIFAVGMFPVVAVMIFFLTIYFGSRKWIKALIFSIFFAILLYYFFEEVANISLPRGFLFEGLY